MNSDSTPSQDQLAQIARSIFQAQPFSQFLGAELVSTGEGTAEIRVRNRADLQQQHGFLHGGVISYLVDNSLTFAGGLALGGDAVTAEYKINYIKPAVGEYVLARASTLSITRTQAICQSLVYAIDGRDERLVAAAQGTIMKAHKTFE